MPVYSYSQLTPEVMLSLYLYGLPAPPPTPKTDEGLIRPSGEILKIDVDPVSFMSTGAGRFAKLAQSTLVRDFFYAPDSLLEVTGERQVFTLDKMRGILGGTSSFDFQQRDFADNTNDLALRQLIWGSSSFTISPDTKFVIDADGHRSIENWAVLPFDDDFDFNSANWLTTALEDELASMMDPSGVGQPGRFGLGRKVDLEFHKYNSTVPRSQISYTKETFISEKQWLNSVYHEPFLDDFHDMIDPIANALFNSGVTKFLDSDNRPVIYGTRGNDSLDSSTAARSDYQSPHLSNGVVYVGAGGDDKFYDTAAGDVMLGGAGQDTNANDFHFI